MGGLRADVVKRIVWPARASLFAVIGGAVGLFGDLVNFFADFLSAEVLVIVFAVVTGIAALLCFQRAVMIDTSNEAAVAEVVDCAPCDAFRFGLFATAAFLLLLLVGQGQSATETVGRQLGLIQTDVSAIRDDVGELRALAQPQMIVKSPKTAAEHFNNGWIYMFVQRDPAKAYAEMKMLYARHSPKKLDAAQLYFDSGSAVSGRKQILDEMQALAKARGDATLLVIAARAAPSREVGNDIAGAARALDPELPFTWWDVMRPQQQGGGGFTSADAAETAARQRAERADIEKFRTLYSEKPPAAFFFLPQFQADYEALARQTSENLAQTIATYEDISSGRLAQRTREAARKAYDEAQAANR